VKKPSFIGVVVEVDPNLRTHLFIIVVPGELNEAAAIIGRVFLPTPASIFADRAEFGISKPAIVSLGAVLLPIVED
jgi:hypothetical protein